MLWSVRISQTTATAALAFVAKLLKLLPLLRRQHRLQPTISLTTNLIKLWFHLLPHAAYLLASVAEDLLHLRLLIRRELQTLRQLLETITAAAERPRASINIERQNAGCETKHEDDQRRNPNLPPVPGYVGHDYLASSSSWKMVMS